MTIFSLSNGWRDHDGEGPCELFDKFTTHGEWNVVRYPPEREFRTKMPDGYEGPSFKTAKEAMRHIDQVIRNQPTRHFTIPT